MAQPWEQKFQGRRQAVTDAQRAIQEFSHEHLDELLEGLVAEGEAAAEAKNSAAQAVVEAHRRWEEIAREMSATVQAAGIRPTPDLVTRSRSDALANAASRFLDTGGEQAPRLTRDPRMPTTGMPVEAA